MAYTNDPNLDVFIEQLKENGFTIILVQPRKQSDLPTYFNFWKDGRVGYVQKSYFEGYDFSTEHRPNKETGSGFGVLEMAELTIENALKALISPAWAYKYDVQHYESPEEFVKREKVLKKYILP